MWKTTLKTAAILTAVNLVQAAGAEENRPQDRITDWQLNQIHHPSEALLKRERRGLVTIYDGFTDVQVNHALDQNFPRIGNMMFTRIKSTDTSGRPLRDPETGEEVVEDDGCDE